MMDAVTLVANVRSTTEDHVANDMTVRQLMHVVNVYMKDKTLVLNLIASSFAGKSGKAGGPPSALVGQRAEGAHENSTPGASGLPRWFRAKPGYRVVSMDAPMGQVLSAFAMGRMPGR